MADFEIKNNDYFTPFKMICKMVTPEDVDDFFTIMDIDFVNSFINDVYKIVDSKEELLYAAYYMYILESYKTEIIDVFENTKSGIDEINWFGYTFHKDNNLKNLK